MISLELWAAFVATVFVLVVSPGPSVALAAANGMRHGARRTTATILGDLSANVIQMTLAALGLGVMLMASAHAFSLMKWAGVVYLIYLGLKYWRADPQPLHADAAAAKTSVPRLYWQGFAVSAANPKAVLFFAALFPLFLDPGLPQLPQLLILGVTFVVMDGVALTLYARFAQRLRTWLTDRDRLRWQNRITGTLLLGGGLALALIRRD